MFDWTNTKALTKNEVACTKIALDTYPSGLLPHFSL
jgi:hypothetical protein